MKHLVLIDGHHLMYRAYYAIPANMKSSKGELTNAVYGVASMLISILNTEKPDALLFCFDKGEETFRHQENATYKDGRAETPDEFFAQIPRIIELIDTMKIAHVADVQYEADDFLGAYATQASTAGMHVTIVTGDRDALQLASDTIRVAIPHKAYQQAEYLGPSEIYAKYGVRPDQIASYKGLIGDASDNLPGVVGIGPKTASALLQQYDTLKGVYDHIDDIKPSVREKLLRDKDQAFFCERMATLVCDLPLPVSLEELMLKDMPVDPALAFFRTLEFATLARRFLSLTQSTYGLEHFAPSSPEPVVTSAESQLTLF
jgi:DNA polymerase-1